MDIPTIQLLRCPISPLNAWLWSLAPISSLRFSALCKCSISYYSLEFDFFGTLAFFTENRCFEVFILGGKPNEVKYNLSKNFSSARAFLRAVLNPTLIAPCFIFCKRTNDQFLRYVGVNIVCLIMNSFPHSFRHNHALSFHLMEFWATFAFSIVSLSSFVVARRPLYQDPVVLKLLLFMNVVFSIVPAILVTEDLHTFEVSQFLP